MASKRSRATKKAQNRERQERVRALQKQQERADRRRNILIFGTTAVVALAIIGGTIWGITQESDASGDSRLSPASDSGIEGLQSADVPERDHVEGEVDYPESPPVGGKHNSVWQNCGFYDEPVNNENAVHALEHGTVWITYSPDLPQQQVDQLRSHATQGAYVLISPYEDLPSPIVASAWGYQLQLDSADDPRLQQFLNTYERGEQTLEPGAACTGGVGEPSFGG